jgi:hypothetical protein
METALLPAADPVPAEVTGFLAQLAVALHKQRAYPPGHPMRRAAQASTFRALGGLLAVAPSVRIGVARHQLVVDDGATDPDHFVIRDLAVRLHRRQVGSVSFRDGITEAEFVDVLERLTVDSSSNRTELLPPIAIETEHVTVTPIAFDALSLREADDVGVQIDQLWQELASVLSGSGGPGAGPGGPEDATGTFAQLLLERLAAPEVRATMAATIERMGRLSQTLDGEERERAEARLRDLLATLPPDALGVLLDIDLGRRDQLGNLLPAVEWLPALALIEVVESAARAQQQEMSNVLLRLLKKLARQSRGSGGPRPLGDRDVRTVVRSLLQDWTLNDPNSKSHAHILEVLARHDVVTAADGAPSEESIRILQMALETGGVGDHVTEAVERSVARGQTDEVAALLELAGSGTVPTTIWATLAAVPQLRRILADERISPETVARILEHTGPDAAPVLIDRLVTTSTGPSRAAIAARLVAMGPTVGLELFRRIDAVGATERRHLLAVLAELPSLPEAFNVRVYLESPEPLTRVEAYRLMIRRPAERDDAIHAALADDDERVVRVAIEAGLEQLPRQSLTRLMLLLNSPKRTVELKAAAAPMLSQFDGLSIREWLLSNLVTRPAWFRRRRLVAKTPLVVAKLRVLATRWRGTPAVDRVLELARRTGDLELVAAVEGGEP